MAIAESISVVARQPCAASSKVEAAQNANTAAAIARPIRATAIWRAHSALGGWNNPRMLDLLVHVCSKAVNAAAEWAQYTRFATRGSARDYHSGARKRGKTAAAAQKPLALRSTKAKATSAVERRGANASIGFRSQLPDCRAWTQATLSSSHPSAPSAIARRMASISPPTALPPPLPPSPASPAPPESSLAPPCLPSPDREAPTSSTTPTVGDRWEPVGCVLSAQQGGSSEHSGAVKGGGGWAGRAHQ